MGTSTRVVILSGGNLESWALAHIRPEHTIIAADRGAWFAVQHGIKPHMSLGDFDSISAEQLAAVRANSEQVRACDPVWKDLTDTEMAFEYALGSGASEILLLGATGTRLDHTIANIHLLAKADQAGVTAAIADANNLIQIASSSRRLEVERSEYPYVSLLPLTEQVTGITLSGFRYALQDASLTIGQSLGVSNELSADVGSIILKSGKLLVIQSKD